MSSPIALVTGSTSGIGLACALALIETGYRVVFHSRSRPHLAEQLARQHEHSSYVIGDLASEADCQAMIAQVLHRHG